MTTAESHLRAWADQAIRPVIREILRDELADLFPATRNQDITPDADPYGNFDWLVSICSGVPKSTLRIKSAAGEIPGIVKFGKRVLYKKEIVLNWLMSQTRGAVDMAKIEQNADLQINAQLLKQSHGGVR